MNVALVVLNLVQLAIIIAIVAAWLGAAERHPRSRLWATAAAAFAGTLGLALAVLGVLR